MPLLLNCSLYIGYLFIKGMLYIIITVRSFIEAEMYIGIFGWLFMAKCHSNNFNVSKGLVQSAQTEP